jgi:hypothetical protein
LLAGKERVRWNEQLRLRGVWHPPFIRREPVVSSPSRHSQPASNNGKKSAFRAFISAVLS